MAAMAGAPEPNPSDKNQESQPAKRGGGKKQGEFDYFFEKIRKIDFQSFLKPLALFSRKVKKPAIADSGPLKKIKLSFLSRIPIKTIVIWGFAIALCYFIFQNMFVSPAAKEKEKKEAEKK